VEQILLVTVGMADTMMVSSVGEAAISAISLVDSINLLLINIFSALGTGGAIVTAQYLGREDDENASRAAKQLIYVIGAVSTAVMLICLAANGPILRALFGNVGYAQPPLSGETLASRKVCGDCRRIPAAVLPLKGGDSMAAEMLHHRTGRRKKITANLRKCWKLSFCSQAISKRQPCGRERNLPDTQPRQRKNLPSS